MAEDVCKICGRPIIEAQAWKRCTKYGGTVCVKHCADTCKTLFGDYCPHSSTHAPTASSPPRPEYMNK